jgi:hypothetical protein
VIGTKVSRSFDTHPENGKLNIKITWKYCLAFYCMTMLYVSLHELVHHFAGAAICGDWGYKTFNYFETACSEDSRIKYLATFAGPVFTYAVIWVGAWMLRKPQASQYTKQLGFALIFAQLPLQRMTSPIFRMNDEFYTSVQLWGDTSLVYWGVLVIIWLICLPPLWIAYRNIENRYKILWFLFYLVLFPYLIWGPVFGVLEFLLVSRGVLDGTIIGIANLFILNEIVTIIGYIYTKKYFDPALN